MRAPPVQVSAAKILTGAAFIGAGIAVVAASYLFEDLPAVLIFLDGGVAILLGALLALRGISRPAGVEEEAPDVEPPAGGRQAAPMRRGRPTPA